MAFLQVAFHLSGQWVYSTVDTLMASILCSFCNLFLSFYLQIERHHSERWAAPSLWMESLFRVTAQLGRINLWKQWDQQMFVEENPEPLCLTRLLKPCCAFPKCEGGGEEGRKDSVKNTFFSFWMPSTNIIIKGNNKILNIQWQHRWKKAEENNSWEIL